MALPPNVVRILDGLLPLSDPSGANPGALEEAVDTVRNAVLGLRQDLHRAADPLTMTLQGELTRMLGRWRASEARWEPATRLDDQAETLWMVHRDLTQAREHLDAWTDQDRAQVRHHALDQQAPGVARRLRSRS